MKSHWIKRIVRLLVLLFGVSILCFILTALSSTDPATYLVRRGNLSPTPEVIEQVRAELGLDQPLPIRYLNWIGGVFRGDFGESIFSTNEVAADLAAYFPQTLQLVFLSLAEIIVFSILLGVLCAAKKNKLTDHIMRIVSLFGILIDTSTLALAYIKSSFSFSTILKAHLLIENKVLNKRVKVFYQL